MSLNAWLDKLRTKARHSRSKPRRRAATFRPTLEALEPRLVLATTRIWSGGDPFSPQWSAYLNWANGAFFPSPPVLETDSVEFPADAKQRSNVNDLTNHS